MGKIANNLILFDKVFFYYVVKYEKNQIDLLSLRYIIMSFNRSKRAETQTQPYSVVKNWRDA